MGRYLASLPFLSLHFVIPRKELTRDLYEMWPSGIAGGHEQHSSTNNEACLRVQKTIRLSGWLCPLFPFRLAVPTCFELFGRVIQHPRAEAHRPIGAGEHVEVRTAPAPVPEFLVGGQL